MTLTQAGRLLTVTTPLGKDAFVATQFSGREQLSRPFRFSLDLASENAAVKPADLVGQPIGWTVNRPDDAPRQFHGLVRRLAAGPPLGRGLRSYRAEVVPWLWFLTLTSDCKIFQKKTAPDIVKLVFGGLGFSDYKLSLTGTYPEREYCVQYRETALDFVSRLLEEEGIFYSFEYAADKHTLVLADAPSAYKACDPHKKVEYRPDFADADVISAWERNYEFGPGSYAHADYNFTTPAAKLLASADTLVKLPNIANFERFDFPGNHTVAADGTARAKVRTEEFEATHDTASGRSRCSSFRPGCKFTLANHPGDDGDYVLTAVDHAASDPTLPGLGGGGADYSNTFEATPATVPADVTKGDRVVTVGEGNDTHTVNKGNRVVEVDQGDHQVTVKAGKSVTTVQGDDTHTVKQGKREVIVELGDDTLTVKVGNQVTKISAGKQIIEALQGITLKSGPSEVTIGPDGVSIKGLTVKIEGQTQTSIKGLLTEVNADAMLKLKGGVVMVN